MCKIIDNQPGSHWGSHLVLSLPSRSNMQGHSPRRRVRSANRQMAGCYGTLSNVTGWPSARGTEIPNRTSAPDVGVRQIFFFYEVRRERRDR